MKKEKEKNFFSFFCGDLSLLVEGACEGEDHVVDVSLRQHQKALLVIGSHCLVLRLHKTTTTTTNVRLHTTTNKTKQSTKTKKNEKQQKKKKKKKENNKNEKITC